MRFAQIFGIVAFIGGFALMLWNCGRCGAARVAGRRKLWSVVLVLAAFIVLWVGRRVQAHRLRDRTIDGAGYDSRVAVERLRSPRRFASPGFVFEQQEAVVVTLDDGVHRGRGEASGVYYLDDTAIHGGRDRGAARTRSRRASIALRCSGYCRPGGARNALDCALWELDAHAPAHAGVGARRICRRRSRW